MKAKAKAKVRLLGSGTILQQVRAAASILAEKYDVDASVFSATSFNELARDGLDVERYNMLNPTKERRKHLLLQCWKKKKAQ